MTDPRLFHPRPRDWTWWAWALTTALLACTVAGDGRALAAATGLTALQALAVAVRDRRLTSFALQLRLVFLLLLLVGSLPGMTWVLWVLLFGTCALVLFGYCLLARLLSLLPWNGREGWSWNRLRRTFFSAPDPTRAAASRRRGGCDGSLCTIEAQVAPPSRPEGVG